jgi:hypothetical protein
MSDAVRILLTRTLKESGQHELGVIAEEVGAVVPEIVSWEENGKDALGVDYSRLTDLLIEATKETTGLDSKTAAADRDSAVADEGPRGEDRAPDFADVDGPELPANRGAGGIRATQGEAADTYNKPVTELLRRGAASKTIDDAGSEYLYDHHFSPRSLTVLEPDRELASREMSGKALPGWRFDRWRKFTSISSGRSPTP